MTTHFKIAVLPGDGIGVDVTREALRVLQALEGVTFSFEEHAVGAAEYLLNGDPLPASALEACAKADAVLLGAMGLPSVRWPDGKEMTPQIDLREKLDLYAGPRPIKLYHANDTPLKGYRSGGVPAAGTEGRHPSRPESEDRATGMSPLPTIDFVIVRENTEGLFSARLSTQPSSDEARDVLRLTRQGCERVIRFAFELARKRRKHCTLVDKANVLPSMVFFRRIFDEIATEYPDVTTDRVYVDAMALFMVRKPEAFDVIVTENMFGDILSDLAGGLVGGMGMAPSGDIGEDCAIFQPSHGTAPDIAGKGIANPVAMILSAAMMLDWLGLPEAAKKIETAVQRVFDDPANRTPDMGGKLTTSGITDLIIGELEGRHPVAHSFKQGDKDVSPPIDLTLTMRLGMRGVDWEQAKTVEKEGWNARTLHLYSHAGTHMDAQTHFAAGPGTIDVTPLDRCMGPAWVVKLDGIADKTLITVAHLGDIAAKFPPGDSLLLCTGWSQHVGNPQHYRDNFPRISEELARWCVEHEVNVLGVESPSVADVNNMAELTLIHQILLGANITIVEGLTNLSALTSEKVFFVAAPLKIEGGDGCPCRAFAWGSGDIPVAESKGSKKLGGKDAAPPSSLTFLSHPHVTAHRNRLPHWQQEAATYFITFRMADCLPESLLGPWRNERDTWLQLHPKPWSEDEEEEYLERFTLRIEHWLDEGHGSCQLRQPECRDLMSKTLQHFNGERCDLHAFVVMPNHVHVLVSLREGTQLEKLMHSWKSYSAQQLNRLLSQDGEFWMKDYFDRSIRDGEHFDRVLRYIEKNPVKAKLREGEYALWKRKGDISVAPSFDKTKLGGKDAATPA